MSFALSQRRADRHPVGLAIVVGLHVVLAAALLSAKLHTGPAAQPTVALTPIDEPPKPVQRRTDDVLPPPRQHELRITVPTPEIPVDQTADPVIQAQPVDSAPVVPPGPVAIADPDANKVLGPVRVQPRPARINAGAAQCHPEYPAAAQRAGASGSTRIRFTVDASGRISGSQILHASGATREHRLLDQAAVAALAQCPVQVGTDETGRPVGTTTDVEYVWTLN